MVVNDFGKLLVVLVALVGGLILAMVSMLTDTPGGMASGLGLASLALGYVFGNGRLAQRGEAPSTMVAPVLPTDEYIHIDELRQLPGGKTAARSAILTRLGDRGHT